MASGPFVPLGLLAYTYIGYPAAIGLLARLLPLQTQRDPSYTPFVSVLLPAYNVAQYLDAKLDSLLALDYPTDKLEILVYNDASTDSTGEILDRRAALDSRVRPVHSAERSGKPTGLNRMRQQARGEVFLMTD